MHAVTDGRNVFANAFCLIEEAEDRYIGQMALLLSLHRLTRVRILLGAGVKARTRWDSLSVNEAHMHGLCPLTWCIGSR